jgi:hypothetical protein
VSTVGFWPLSAGHFSGAHWQVRRNLLSKQAPENCTLFAVSCFSVPCHHRLGFALFRQWEGYKSTGVTPVRRKTEARRNRDKQQKLIFQSPAIDLSKIIWKGKMSCNKCQYLWQSRKPSPPARCPKCNSSNLTVLREGGLL